MENSRFSCELRSVSISPQIRTPMMTPCSTHDARVDDLFERFRHCAELRVQVKPRTHPPRRQEAGGCARNGSPQDPASAPTSLENHPGSRAARQQQEGGDSIQDTFGVFTECARTNPRQTTTIMIRRTVLGERRMAGFSAGLVVTWAAPVPSSVPDRTADSDCDEHAGTSAECDFAAPSTFPGSKRRKSTRLSPCFRQARIDDQRRTRARHESGSGQGQAHAP